MNNINLMGAFQHGFAPNQQGAVQPGMAPKAPSPQPSGIGGFLQDFRQNNPGALTRLGQSIASPNPNHTAANAFAQQGEVNATLKYLKSKGADEYELAAASRNPDAMKALMRAATTKTQAKAPKTMKAADGYTYQWDANNNSWNRSLPDVVKKESNGITIGPDGTVQIGGSPKQSAKFATQSGKNDSDLIKEARDSAKAAHELKATVQQMGQVSSNVGYTGPGGAVIGGADDLLTSATGGWAKDWISGDSGARGAFKNMSMEAQLSMTEKTKGAITDREMGMFKAAVPGLGQTREGNEQIMKVMNAAADRAIQRVTEMEKWQMDPQRGNGTLNGFDQYWNEYLEANPLILATPDGGIRLNDGSAPAPDNAGANGIDQDTQAIIDHYANGGQ